METSKKSTGKKLKGQTSSAEVTRVSLSVRQVNGEVKKIRGICGHGSEQPLASYDLDTQSWKMFGDISLWGDCPLLVNLPVSGMTRSGVLFLQHPWEPITAETELLLWPTPRANTAMSATITPESAWNPNRQPNLETIVGRRTWPTPKASDAKRGDSPSERNRHTPSLPAAVNMWPTPTSTVRPMEGNVRLYRAKVQAGEMTEAEAEAILGKSVWEAQGKLPEMWPTPTTQETEHPDAVLTETGRRLSKDGKTSHSLGLADAVQMWPTPTASDWKGRGPNSKQQGLPEVVKKNPYPTMSASGMGNTGSRQMLDKKIADGSLTEEEKRAMTAGNGGKLNPTWVEWLMGFPEGWTDLED